MQIQINDTVSFGDLVVGETDAFGVEWYFIDLVGWEPSDSTVQMTQRAGADGGFASPAFLQSGVYTVTGGMVAPDRPTLVAAKDRLNAAAALAAQPVTVASGGAVRYSLGQRQTRPNYTEQGDTYAQFAITFVAEDPRKFADDLTASTLLPSATGGWTFPFTFPFSINSTVVSGLCTLTNPGNAVGPVKLRIDGPVVGPQITHVGSGASIVFATSYTLAAGNWLDIDMDARTVLENGQAERMMFVNQYGWSGFEPGQNEWAYAAINFNTTTRLTVTATPAWL